MSHEIDFTTGRPAFTFDRDDGPAWHGLGTPIPESDRKDPRKIAEHAGAAYTVEKRPVYFQDTNGKLISVPNREVLVRDDTNEPLEVVSQNKYKVHQPVEYFETFRDSLAEGGLHISSAGVLKGGRTVFVTAALHEGAFSVGSGKDQLHPYVIIGGDYTGKGSSFALHTAIRAVCWNTLSAALSGSNGKRFRIPHTAAFNGKALAQAIGLMGAEFAVQSKVFNELARKPLTANEAGLFFADVLDITHEELTAVDVKTGKPVLSGKVRAQLDSLARAYSTAPGAVPGNLWGALNAVTYFVDHEAATRDSYDDGTSAARFHSAKFGTGANVKTRALELAISRAGIDLEVLQAA